jgi:HD-GYP domain-containing protein (c-di-GMP phosphodiesterase class II)
MDYIPVRINTLTTDIKLGFNLYIKLPTRFLHYIKSEDSLDVEVKKNLKQKKIRKLYIPNEQENEYLSFLDRCLSSVKDDPNLSSTEKAGVVSSISKDLSEQIYTKGVDEKSYKSVQKAGVALIDLLESDEEMIKNIFDLKSNKDDSTIDKILHHGVSTSALCVAFATFLKLDKQQIETLSVAGLMHDLAFMKYEEEHRNLFFKDIKEMDAKELTVYKEHPQKAVELLSDKPFASKDVVDLIVTHEEKISGEGFPKKLKKLTKIQEVHALCCFFDRQINCLEKKKNELIDDLLVGQLGNYDMELLKQFKAFAKGSL